MARICVVGAGPAGCVFSARMAQLGHEVTLVERATFPRSRLGESLSPGVLPLLEMLEARQAVEDARFPRIHTVTTTWDGEIQQRHDPQQQGLLVDRGRFDTLLLERVRTLGVRILQPAIVTTVRAVEGGSRVIVTQDGHAGACDVDFVADATGRRGALPGRRVRQRVSTVALYAYWQGAGLPDQPRIEAGEDAWYWGVPLPDGRYNTLVFLDAARVRAHRGRPLESLLRSYLNRSGLMGGSPDAALLAPVCAIDATPYVDEECVAPSRIKIGDAALAIDPLSSSGVQKAIQTALAAAVVTNTLLRRPQSADAAMRFYRTTIADAARRHRGWAAAQYARVAARGLGPFWEARATGGMPEPEAVVRRADHDGRFDTAVGVSSLLEFVDLPCIDGEFVTTKPAVRHPALDGPVAYVGTWELRPLLDDVRDGMTPLDIARAWMDRVPLRSGLSITRWLLDRQLLVPAARADAGSAATDEAYTRGHGSRRTP